MAADVQQAWGEYLTAIEALYGRSADALMTMGEVGIAGEPGPDEIETALKKSDALGFAIQENLDSSGAEQRELAVLQLSAAAVVDLSVAHDLALNAGAEEILPEFESGAGWATEGVETPRTGEPALTNELATVAPILAAPPDAGIWVTIVGGGAPREPGEPREDLEKAVDSALDSICADAAQAGTMTFHGLLTLPGVDLAQVAGSVLASVFDNIEDEAGHFLKRAVRFLQKGLEKILSIFGTNTQEAFKKVAAWAEGLIEDGIRKLLELIYGVKNAEERLHTSIEAAASEEKMEDAGEALEGLETKFGKQMSIVRKVAWLVNKIRAWLWPVAPPWSQIGVALGYLSATAYIVCAGGDYVDWGDADGGWMNLVPGVEGIVSDAVGETF